MSIDATVAECREVAALAYPASSYSESIHKRRDGLGSLRSRGIIQRAVAAIKSETPNLLVITDVCLCEYHEPRPLRVVRGEEILNDPTLDLLSRQAVSTPAPERISWPLRI